MTYKVRKLNDDVFGELTILVSDNTGCWFISKEIFKAIKTKVTNKILESIVSQSNLIKLRYLNHKQNKEYSDVLWPNNKDHSDKYLINKFGVLQLIHSIKSYNTNNIVEHFIGITFKNFVMQNVVQKNVDKNCLSELEKQRLRLFSDDKYEVIEAHKAIIKIETERQKILKDKNAYIQSKIERDKINNSLEEELNCLRNENCVLKNQVGRGTEWCTVGFKKREWKNRFGHYPDWKMLCSISNQLNIQPIKDVIEKDKRGIERKVNRYHIDVWNLYEFEEIRRKNGKQPKQIPSLDLKMLPFDGESE